MRSETFFLLHAKPWSLDSLLLLVGTVTAVLVGASTPSLGSVYSRLLDGLSTREAVAWTQVESQQGPARQYIKMIMMIACCHFVLNYISLACWGLFGERLTQRIQYAALSALVHQDLAHIDAKSPGELDTYLDTDIDNIRRGVGEQLGILISLASSTTFSYGVSFWESPTTTWKMSLLLPLYLLFPMLGQETVLSRTIDEGISAACAFASDTLCHLMVVHAFQASSRFEKRFNEKLRSLDTTWRVRRLFLASHASLLHFLPFALKATAVWHTGQITVGQATAVSSNLIAMSLTISSLVPSWNAFTAARSSYEQLLPTLSRNSKIDARSLEGLPAPKSPAVLDVREVRFRYPDCQERFVLDRISFQIPGRGTIAIVGSSGGGKSTLASLVCRLYDPISGSIQLDGRDIRDYNIRSLRSSIALADQRPVLMSCSVLENVAQGLVRCMEGWPTQHALSSMVERVRSGQTWEEAARGSVVLRAIVFRVVEALQLTEASKFVSALPYGMATEIGPGGASLSGGQTQQLALARAVIRNAPILILDEATSEVDAMTERSIQDNLRVRYADRAIVFITHKLSTVQTCDNIILIDNGTVVDQGCFTQLMSNDGAFAKLVHFQHMEAHSEHSDPEAGKGKQLEVIRPAAPLTHAPERSKQSISTVPAYPQIVSFFREHTLSQNCYVWIAILATMLLSASPLLDAVLMASAQTAVPHSTTAQPQSTSVSHAYCLMLVATGMIVSATGFLGAYAIDRVTESFLSRVRVLSLHALLDKDLAWHDSHLRLRDSAFADATLLDNLTATIIEHTIGAAVSSTVGPAFAHVVAWKVAVMLLPTLPLVSAAGVLCSKLLGPLYALHYEAFRRSIDTNKASLSRVRHLICFGLEEEALRAFADSLAAHRAVRLRKVIYANFFLAASMSFPLFVHGITYWWGVKQIFAGHCSAAQMFMALPSLASGAHGLGKIMGLPHELARTGPATTRISNLVALIPRKQEISNLSGRSNVGTTAFTVHDGEALRRRKVISWPQNTPIIELRSIHFAYPSRPTREVLGQLTLTIPRGSFCAFVGDCGSGKSTILSLIEGLYAPSRGRVLINGEDIHAEGSGMHHYRRSMSLVPQVNSLFEGPVAFNLNVGSDPSVEMSPLHKLQSAARSAGIHEVIRALPSGYQTDCGTVGSRFSGGETQRLCNARALVREPEILLLDEPTSGLDSQSEARWKAHLHTVNKQDGVTVVVVAHKLHTIQRADIIFVINQGLCVDQGTHRELLGRSSWYRRNVLQQSFS
ncbi:unnamed protein product [Cercospora beticola]|nr:unnamed protein product [Cercospora beticola]